MSQENISQHGTIRIKGKEFPTETREVSYKILKFFVENPRIYSLIRPDERAPDQESICKQLLEMDHVKELIQDIKSNGGLIDPLIVRTGDNVVLEGNSRLAAYHQLVKQDPIKWSLVKCTFLPENIDEKSVFALLGQYHVKGKKDWAPYERAGFLWRRHKLQNVELSIVALELGIKKAEAEKLVEVYDFMIKHHDTDRERWSYYYEYLKSRKVGRARKEHAGFDDFIVSEIKSGDIPSAMDLRDKLPAICSGPPKTLKRYIEGRQEFEDAYEAAGAAGAEHAALLKVAAFRDWLAKEETEEDMKEAHKAIRDKIAFGLKQIKESAIRLNRILENIGVK